MPESNSSAISTNLARPVSPLLQPELAQFTVSPGTIREEIVYKEGARTVLTLTGPAIKPFVCKVVSSDSEKLLCGDISFQKGDQEQRGTLEINWKNIANDCQVAIKVYDPVHPETILHSRLYLRKSLVPAN